MNEPRWKCQECGRKFRTTKAAERASMNGCPKCGGVDIDLDVDETRPRKSDFAVTETALSVRQQVERRVKDEIRY